MGGRVPAAGVMYARGDPVGSDRDDRIRRLVGEVERLIDELGGTGKRVLIQCRLRHAGHQQRQQLAIADTPQLRRPLGEHGLGFRGPALLQQHLGHVEPELPGHAQVLEGFKDPKALLRV